MKRKIAALFIIGSFIIIVFNPTVFAAGVFEAMSLCVKNVIPSLFLFTVLSGVVSDMELFKNPVIEAAVMGSIGGYPVGAICAVNMHRRGQIGSKTCRSVLNVSVNCSLGFCIGVLSAVTNKGWLIYLIQLFTSIFTGSLFFKADYINKEHKGNLKLGQSIVSSVNKAVSSGITIIGFTAFASVFTTVLGLLPDEFTYLAGLFDLTQGVFLLPESPIGFALLCFYVTFGGACVLLQVGAICHAEGIRIDKLILSKFIAGCYAFLLGFLFFDGDTIIYGVIAVILPLFLHRIIKTATGEKEWELKKRLKKLKTEWGKTTPLK